jgi:GNAT superfamily N-acetyltransferase
VPEDSPELFVLAPENGEAAGVLSQRLRAGGGRATFVGLGRSMEPTLLAGDRLQIETISLSMRTGWIVVFPWREHILTHRVITVQGQVFFARGDACSDAEGPVPVADAIGRVTAFWRDGSWHSMQGAREQSLGLLYNRMASRVRRLANRWPALRKMALWKGFKAVRRWFYGDIRIEADDSKERVVGALVSCQEPLCQELVREVDGRLGDGSLRMFVAHSSKRGRIGQVLLCRLEADAGRVSALRVSPGARGIGVERDLLSAVEEAARREGVKRLLAPDDHGLVDLFRSVGYRMSVEGVIEKEL